MFPHIRQYMNENDGELSIYVPVHLDGFYKDEFKVDVILDNIKERWTTLSKDILKRIFEISLDHHLLNLNFIVHHFLIGSPLLLPENLQKDKADIREKE